MLPLDEDLQSILWEIIFLKCFYFTILENTYLHRFHGVKPFFLFMLIGQRGRSKEAKCHQRNQCKRCGSTQAVFARIGMDPLG